MADGIVGILLSARARARARARAGDQGGRDILREHRQQLVTCAVVHAGVLMDIDRPDDLPPALASGRPS